jgi:hypothetical protein
MGENLNRATGGAKSCGEIGFVPHFPANAPTLPNTQALRGVLINRAERMPLPKGIGVKCQLVRNAAFLPGNAQRFWKFFAVAAALIPETPRIAE